MNIGDLFDSPWKVLIIAVVVLVMFGSRKMPDAARSLGRSMRILKAEVSKIHDDEPDDAATTAQAQALPAPAAPSPAQQQILELQEQVRQLQQQSAGVNGATAAEAQRTQQPF
jgi:sec-independent protein translocase protein TatA